MTILANPDGVSLTEAAAKAKEFAAEMHMPPAYQLVESGQSKTLGETGYYFLVALLLSTLFMYLILAAQFESWMNPWRSCRHCR